MLSCDFLYYKIMLYIYNFISHVQNLITLLIKLDFLPRVDAF